MKAKKRTLLSFLCDGRGAPESVAAVLFALCVVALSLVAAVLPLALALVVAALPLALGAAVPLSWTVETSRVQPASFEAFRGETLDLAAALESLGRPLLTDAQPSLYWQTNGMNSAWWSAPATNAPLVRSICRVGSADETVTQSVFRAAWRPEYDCGAKTYACFIGASGSIYRAAYQLRLRDSPGASPNALPLPVPVIDFAKVTVLNPPWAGGGGLDTNAVRAIAGAVVAPVSNRTEEVAAVMPTPGERVGDTVFAKAAESAGRAASASTADALQLMYPHEAGIYFSANSLAWKAYDPTHGEFSLIPAPDVSGFATTQQVTAVAAEVAGKRDYFDMSAIIEDGSTNWMVVTNVMPFIRSVTLVFTNGFWVGENGVTWDVLESKYGRDEWATKVRSRDTAETATRDLTTHETWLATALETDYLRDRLTYAEAALAEKADASEVAETATNAARAVVAELPTTYAATNALVALNQSVQFVVADGSPLAILPPAEVAGGVRDWLVYVNATAATPLDFSAFANPLLVADSSATNACAANKVTMLAVTEITTNRFALGRSELVPAW